MTRQIRTIAALAAVLAVPAATARAQYGGYGWGGWGGAGTVQGSIARGMGQLAVGEGVYNLRTAQARSINVDTAMRWNDYMWQSQQVANKMTIAKYQREERNINRAQKEIYDRLRNNPTEEDLARGDALNVALDEINNPKVYKRALKGYDTKLDGKTIREIPFEKAAAAVTISIQELLNGGPPAVLRGDAFKDELATIREVAESLRKETLEQGKYNPATTEKGIATLTALKLKVDAKIPNGTQDRLDADTYIKSLIGLSRLLETPASNILLAGLEDRPATTIGDLLSFMNAYNLRFGVAKTVAERQVYDNIYPLLVQLRDEAKVGDSSPWAAAPPDHKGQPTQFFNSLQYGK